MVSWSLGFRSYVHVKTILNYSDPILKWPLADIYFFVQLIRHIFFYPRKYSRNDDGDCQASFLGPSGFFLGLSGIILGLSDIVFGSPFFFVKNIILCKKKKQFLPKPIMSLYFMHIYTAFR